MDRTDFFPSFFHFFFRELSLRTRLLDSVFVSLLRFTVSVSVFVFVLPSSLPLLVSLVVTYSYRVS